ncbi:serine/threonine-protein kinase [Spirosoma fluminis]
MPTVSVNTHFPGYEILGELGRSNARVLKARHIATGDLVAIKHFVLGTDPETLRRFQQESTIMTNIHHPNVVGVREVQVDMPLPFIVMEWVEGGDLRSLLKRGPLDVSAVIRLGQQMAAAFSAIHPQGIIHRDIKPENILYRPLPSGELHFLLTDFGVARLREQSKTLTGQSLLTYEYASPEQFENPRGSTGATDYYSLGVVLYECLTGHLPFSMTESEGIATFVKQVLHTPSPAVLLPAGHYLPPSLNEIVNWTLIKNSAERLSDADELTLLLGQATVEQLQANRSIDQAAPVRPRPQTVAAPEVANQFGDTYAPEYEEPAERSNGWIIAFAVIAVLAIVGLAIFYVNQQKGASSPSIADTTAVDDPMVSGDTAVDSPAGGIDFSEQQTPSDSTEVNTEPSTPPSVFSDTTTVPRADSTSVADSTNSDT